MRFIHTQRFAGGREIISKVEFESFEAAVKEMEVQFYEDPDIKSMEQRKFENGSQSISLKNKENKIVSQLTVINEI